MRPGPGVRVVATVPAHSFCAPALAALIAAARRIPGVRGVFSSSSPPRTIRTPWIRQSGEDMFGLQRQVDGPRGPLATAGSAPRARGPGHAWIGGHRPARNDVTARAALAILGVVNLNRLEPAVVEWLFRFTAPMGQSDTIAVDFEAGEIARVTLPLPASAPSRLYGLDVRRIEVGECSSFDLALELRPDAASILRLRVTTGGGCTLMVSEGGRDIVNVPERRTETFEFRCP